MATGGDYKSKGVHTNRDKTAKMRVSPMDRTGAPFKPRERTVVDDVAQIRARGAKRMNDVSDTINPPKQMGPTKERAAEMNKAGRGKRVAGALASAGLDMQASMDQSEAEMDARHQQAVQEGKAMMQNAQRSTPGKAQAIIKNKRV